VLGQGTRSAAVVGQPGPADIGDLTAVSCADALHCWAVGGTDPSATAATPAVAIAATVDGGMSWKAQRLTLTTPPELSGISCPTKEDCIAVGSTGTTSGGSIVVTTLDGGTTWTQAPSPVNSYGISAVNCASVHQCTAVVNGGLIFQTATTADFGQTWQLAGNLPGGFQGVTSMFCRADGTCLLAGFTPTTAGHGQGAIVYSLDRGQTWSSAMVPTGLGVLQGATCSSESDCLAVGSTSTNISDVVAADGELLTSADGGKTWVRSASTPPVDDIEGIACPGPSECAMVGAEWPSTTSTAHGSVAVSSNAGVTFKTSSTAYVPLPLAALTCPSTVSCIGVGGATLARIALPRPSTTTTTQRRSRTP
jgi:photosystem II stability/assembly factor-like uncharacterized protein